jgi:hypothetical protein
MGDPGLNQMDKMLQNLCVPNSVLGAQQLHLKAAFGVVQLLQKDAVFAGAHCGGNGRPGRAGGTRAG